MPLSAIEKLRAFLRPPGKGLYTHSTGGGYASHLLKALYGTDNTKDVQDAWEEGLQRIRRVDNVLLGVPSDTGAGIMRGANFGPIGVREAYLKRFQTFPKNVLDIGDIIVIPQLLHDEMLSEGQLQASREALYPKITEKLPVSPLSITESVLGALYDLNPKLKIFMIGGDHSTSWPMMSWCSKRSQQSFGLLHFDAHTDMLEHRLGVKYCFATWAYHAQKQLDPQHLIQVGIRTSKFPKEQWMQNFPIKQIWAKEVNGNEDKVIAEVLEHFTNLGIQSVYISNDIDGTDASFAPATGTPETGGLRPEFVKALIAAVKANFGFVGGDIVEVAPPLSGNRNFASDPTCILAAEYLQAFLC